MSVFSTLFNSRCILALETFKFMFSLKFLTPRHTTQPWVRNSSLGLDQLLGHSYHCVLVALSNSVGLFFTGQIDKQMFSDLIIQSLLHSISKNIWRRNESLKSLQGIVEITSFFYDVENLKLHCALFSKLRDPFHQPNWAKRVCCHLS